MGKYGAVGDKIDKYLPFMNQEYKWIKKQLPIKFFIFFR